MTKTERVLRMTLLTFVTVAFFATGAFKLFGTSFEKELFLQWGYPLWFMYVVGVVEVLGAVLLHVKRLSQYAALGLVAVALGAISTHVAHGEGFVAPIPATLLLLSLFGVLYLGRGRSENSIS